MKNHRTLFLTSNICFLLAYTLLLTLFNVTASEDKLDKKNIPTLVGDIKSERIQAETRVRWTKELCKPNDSRYVQSEFLFNAAKKAYDNFNEVLIASIKEGQKLKDFDEKGKKALEANKEFCAFVDKEIKLPSANPYNSTVLELGKLLIDLVGEIKKKRKEERASIAEEVKKVVTWKEWEEIKLIPQK